MFLAPRPSNRPVLQRLLVHNAAGLNVNKHNISRRLQLPLALLVASVVIYTIASLAGTQRHAVAVSADTAMTGWPGGTAYVPVLVDGMADAHAAPIPGDATTHSSGDEIEQVAAAAAAAAVVPEPAVGRKSLEQQLPSSLNQQRHELEVPERHAWMAGHQRQPKPNAVNRTSQPLPWRALHHLSTAHEQGDGSASSSQAPAYLVSAFLDTRPIVHGQRARIAVIMAVYKRINSQGWKCLLRFPGSSANLHVVDLKVAYSVQNHEAIFNYKASTGFCDLPQALQDSLLPNNSSDGASRQQRPSLTVMKGSLQGGTLEEFLLRQPQVWVPLVVIPVLTTQERQHYLSGAGSIAVCTPPVHTDGYAATLVGWQAFHKIMGVQQVFMYSFNPGPLIKPLMDFYAAQGFAQVYEWIIPSSILENMQQECLLPFFHSSEHRARFDSPRCTYHQDNYAIANWGQTLAIQDCVYRAMAAKHRWVAVLDLDEYILPRAAKTWHSMLQQLVTANGGKAAAEYAFNGVRLCSGCLQQQQQQQQQQQRSNTTTAAACQLAPTIGFHHIIWPSAMVAVAPGARADYPKTILDPMAVGQASVHSIAWKSPYSLASGRVLVQRQAAVKVHDRVHDLHKGNTTFAAHMLPLLKANIEQVALATAAGRFDQHALPLWPSPSSACDVCGSISQAELGWPSLQYDIVLCTLLGQRLQDQVRIDVAVMVNVGMFKDPGAWGSADPLMASLYGGHSFSAWEVPLR